MTNPAPIVLIDRAEVERRVCLTKTTIYRLMRGGRFPKPAGPSQRRRFAGAPPRSMHGCAPGSLSATAQHDPIVTTARPVAGRAVVGGCVPDRRNAWIVSKSGTGC